MYMDYGLTARGPATPRRVAGPRGRSDGQLLHRQRVTADGGRDLEVGPGGAPVLDLAVDRDPVGDPGQHVGDPERGRPARSVAVHGREGRVEGALARVPDRLAGTERRVLDALEGGLAELAEIGGVEQPGPGSGL